MTRQAMLAPTVAALREALGADAVRTDAGAAVYRVGDVEPVAAVLPRDESDAARVLALAWEAGLGVVPWGGGAHQCVGHRPTRYDLALDLTQELLQREERRCDYSDDESVVLVRDEAEDVVRR